MENIAAKNQQFQTVSALRVYLKRGDNKRAASFWGRLFEKPLSAHLVQAALKAGVTHASVNLGHMGFTRDAKTVAHDISDIPVNTLPVCVELIGPRRQLEQFVRDQAAYLKETTLVMVDGVHLSVQYLLEMEEAIKKKPHEVEYISAGGQTLPVDHVKA